MESVPGLGLWNRIVSDTSVEKAGETGLTENSRIFKDGRLSGRTIISELLRNMELGQFELTYSVLLPCIFSVYLSPDDTPGSPGFSDTSKTTPVAPCGNG
jgi:hypothetical protein